MRRLQLTLFFYAPHWLRPAIIWDRGRREALEKKITMAYIRDSMAFFGMDTNLTDEEIEDGIRGWHEAVASYGVTAAEAVAGIQMLGESLVESMNEQ